MTKKALLIMTALAMVFGAKVFAQESNLIPFHHIMGYDNSYVLNAMKSRDGEILARAHIRNDDSPSAENLGVMFYKISPTLTEISDSLFMPNNSSYRCNLFERVASCDGFVEVDIDTTETGGFVMHISHFQDRIFPIDTTEEVFVPLFEGENTTTSLIDDPFYLKSCMIDSRGDIIVRYPVFLSDSVFDDHIARFDLDGTLKHEAMLEHDQNYMFYAITQCGFGVFSEHPLKYYRCSATDNMYLYVYDSLFQRENYYVFNKYYLPDEVSAYFEFLSGCGPVMIHDGEDVIILTNYLDNTAGFGYEFPEQGLAVARYNIRTMQRKGLTLINDIPGPYSSTCTKCLLKSSNGYLYLVYRETDYDEENEVEVSTPLTIVKMKPDLNILWKRYIEMPKNYYANYVKQTILYEEENEVQITVVGRCRYEKKVDNMLIHKTGQYYLFLTDNDLLGMNDCKVIIRPYTFYPNPAQDQLHLQYSPDVQPKRIELYDLQGRLVRTQDNTLETLEMSRLAPGTYTMCISLEDGQTFSDKVVKE